MEPRYTPAMLLSLFAAACAPEQPDPGNPGQSCLSEVPEIDFDDAIVGYRYIPHEYALPWDSSARSIGMNVWYPTDAPTDEAARYIDMWDDANSRVESPFKVDDCGKRPLVIYSHGSQAWGGNNSPLLGQFVRNGWIAAAPDHTDNLLNQDLDPKPANFPAVRAADMIETLDWLETLPTDDPLAGRIDTSRVLVLGHSYGGQTSWLLSDVGLMPSEEPAFAAPLGDERIVAVGPMAGSAGADLVDDTTWGEVSVPILYQTGTNDNDGTDAFTRASAADVTWVELEGGCHESFTATQLPCETLPKEEAAPIVAAYTMAFGWAHVLESSESAVTEILDGTTNVSDRVTFHHSR